eukprot:TRINITY_DN19941_c0_g1_i2.p1 TRINITY_DN19941_c0_g1~~TRINITY_DN19941_c0_g1_i2.p1  ORF type:complete len:533 (-),score=135.79 TRINITY_DN19941_c0_g1_i2:128-1726(-)
MGELFELSKLPQPRKVAELAPEVLSFKTFKVKHSQKEVGRVVNLAFSPVLPTRLAVVSGTKVGLWQKAQDSSWEATAQVSKFKDLTQCVAWRGDGKLLLAGEASGTCAVIEAESRKVLRRLRGHGDAVTCAAFATADRSRAATGSRDGKLRLWDITTDQQILEVAAHSDCMKALHAGSGGPDGWVSAGYDNRVKIWDMRVASLTSADSAATSSKATVSADAKKCCTASFNHGQQVEAALVFPGATLCASAGGTAVKVWDLVGGAAAPVQVMEEAHSKAITSISLDGSAKMLLTASFDGLAKVWHAADLGHLWTYRLPAPAASCAWRPDGNAFAIGLEDGSWQLRERKTEAQLEAEQKAITEKAAAAKPYRLRHGRDRGRDAKAGSDDEVMEIEQPKKKRLTQIDFFLKKFEYRKLVEFMVLPTTQISQGLAVVDELLQRGALRASLRDLNESLCLGVLRWCLKAFGSGDSLQEHLVFEALHTLIDFNPCLQPPSTPELNEAFVKLEHKVNQEMRVQEALYETSGMLEMVMNL